MAGLLSERRQFDPPMGVVREDTNRAKDNWMGQVASGCREFGLKRRGGLGQAISNNPSIPWSKRFSDMNYAIQDVMTNGYDKKSVLTAI